MHNFNLEKKLQSNISHQGIEKIIVLLLSYLGTEVQILYYSMKTNHFILNSYVPISFSGSFQLTMYSAVGCWLYANALWASEHKVTPSKIELKFVSSNTLLKNYYKCWTYSRENRDLK